MVGVPNASAAVVAALFALGLAIVAAAWIRGGRRRPGTPAELAVAIAVAAAVASLPYVGWRFAKDLRYTTSLDPYERAAAGPIQSFLPGYLVDGARRVVPPGATYATVVGRAVPYPTARDAFGPLVLTTLFPRQSVPVRDAQWIVAWGVSPASVAPVGKVVVVQRRLGPVPPVYVAKVRR
jgi:hypothetical protein